jgi:hypothetical protein
MKPRSGAEDPACELELKVVPEMNHESNDSRNQYRHTCALVDSPATGHPDPSTNEKES